MKGNWRKAWGQRSRRIHVRTIITLSQARRALLGLVPKSFLKVNLVGLVSSSTKHSAAELSDHPLKIGEN